MKDITRGGVINNLVLIAIHVLYFYENYENFFVDRKLSPRANSSVADDIV